MRHLLRGNLLQRDYARCVEFKPTGRGRCEASAPGEPAGRSFSRARDPVNRPAHVPPTCGRPIPSDVARRYPDRHKPSYWRWSRSIAACPAGGHFAAVRDLSLHQPCRALGLQPSWWSIRESNPLPTSYPLVALPIELMDTLSSPFRCRCAERRRSTPMENRTAPSAGAAEWCIAASNKKSPGDFASPGP